MQTRTSSSSNSSSRGSAFWAAVALAAVLAVVLTWAGAHWRSHLAPQAVAERPTQPDAPVETSLSKLAALAEASMHASRPVLLGSRDPKGNSCVSITRAGDLHGERPNTMGDCNGGPGTTMATLYSFDRQGLASPTQDLAWHQNRLRTWLENELVLNRPAALAAEKLAEASQKFFEEASAWTAFPEGLTSRDFTENTNWPGYCMTALDQAVAKHDLPAVKQWAGELAEAAYSLDDLHRWLEMLCENHLRALDFQQECASLFVESDETLKDKYVPDKSISCFPAGLLSLNGWGNYYEVERQAERLFSLPPDRMEEISTNAHLTPASLWVTPGVRAAFIKLQSTLSQPNQRIWEEAAHTHYEHSYLINMLYRAVAAGVDDDLEGVLKKFDASHPHATIGELMGVLMYRGHAFGGLEWSDRFTPELRQVADSIPANQPDADAFVVAAKWTNQFYRQAQYGATYTLRDALEQKKLDCVRATDMMGAIYRNAGRPRFGNVRICGGTFAHSVAAYLGRSTDDKPQTIIADALDPNRVAQNWPQCYYQGYTWPAGMDSAAHPYSAELYVRGLDSYVWLEGYIIRGPNAGTLATARIPYSTHRRLQTSQKSFDGPYPQ